MDGNSLHSGSESSLHSQTSKNDGIKIKSNFSIVPLTPTSDDPSIVLVTASKDGIEIASVALKLGDDPDIVASSFIQKYKLPSKIRGKIVDYFNYRVISDVTINSAHETATRSNKVSEDSTPVGEEKRDNISDSPDSSIMFKPKILKKVPKNKFSPSSLKDPPVVVEESLLDAAGTLREDEVISSNAPKTEKSETAVSADAYIAEPVSSPVPIVDKTHDICDNVAEYAAPKTPDVEIEVQGKNGFVGVIKYNMGDDVDVVASEFVQRHHLPSLALGGIKHLVQDELASIDRKTIGAATAHEALVEINREGDFQELLKPALHPCKPDVDNIIAGGGILHHEQNDIGPDMIEQSIIESAKLIPASISSSESISIAKEPIKQASNHEKAIVTEASSTGVATIGNVEESIPDIKSTMEETKGPHKNPFTIAFYDGDALLNKNEMLHAAGSSCHAEEKSMKCHEILFDTSTNKQPLISAASAMMDRKMEIKNRLNSRLHKMVDKDYMDAVVAKNTESKRSIGSSRFFTSVSSLDVSKIKSPGAVPGRTSGIEVKPTRSPVDDSVIVGAESFEDAFYNAFHSENLIPQITDEAQHPKESSSPDERLETSIPYIEPEPAVLAENYSKMGQQKASDPIADSNAFEVAFYESQRALWERADHNNLNNALPPASNHVPIRASVVSRQINVQTSNRQQTDMNKASWAKAERPNIYERLYRETELRRAAKERLNNRFPVKQGVVVQSSYRTHNFLNRFKPSDRTGNNRNPPVDMYEDSMVWKQKRDNKLIAYRFEMIQKTEEDFMINHTFHPKINTDCRRARSVSPAHAVRSNVAASDASAEESTHKDVSKRRSRSSDTSAYSRNLSNKPVYARLYEDSVARLQKSDLKLEEAKSKEIKGLFQPELCKESVALAKLRRERLTTSVERASREVGSRSPPSHNRGSVYSSNSVVQSEYINNVSSSTNGVSMRPKEKRQKLEGEESTVVINSVCSSGTSSPNNLDSKVGSNSNQSSPGRPAFQYTSGYEDSTWLSAPLDDVDSQGEKSRSVSARVSPVESVPLTSQHTFTEAPLLKAESQELRKVANENDQYKVEHLHSNQKNSNYSNNQTRFKSAEILHSHKFGSEKTGREVSGKPIAPTQALSPQSRLNSHTASSQSKRFVSKNKLEQRTRNDISAIPADRRSEKDFFLAASVSQQDATLLEVLNQLEPPNVLKMLEDHKITVGCAEGPESLGSAIVVESHSSALSNPISVSNVKQTEASPIQHEKSRKSEQSNNGEQKFDIFDHLYQDAHVRAVDRHRKVENALAEFDAMHAAGPVLSGKVKQLSIEQRVMSLSNSFEPSSATPPVAGKVDFFKRLEEFKAKRAADIETIRRQVEEERGLIANKPNKMTTDRLKDFLKRRDDDLKERTGKRERMMSEKLAEIDKASASSKICPRSNKIVSNHRRDAFSEIFDVLLWSVSFTTKKFESGGSGSLKSFDADVDLGFCISGKADILDTTKAMPQLIRPQDLANIVTSLFLQLPTSNKRLSREDFIDHMESFTDGHGFVHSRDTSKSQVSLTGQPRPPSMEGGIQPILSREFSFSSSRSNNNGKALSASTRNVPGLITVPPSSYPVNMLLNSQNDMMRGSIDKVISKHSADPKIRRSHSSDRRVASASEFHGSAYNNYAAKKRSTSAGRIRNSENGDAKTIQPQFKPIMAASAKSSKLAYQGIQGERRKIGLSVGAGLHSCDQLYQEKRNRRISELQKMSEDECTFNPNLPGKESFMRAQLRRSSLSSSGFDNGGTAMG